MNKIITWYDPTYLWEMATAIDIYQTPHIDNWERCPYIAPDGSVL